MVCWSATESSSVAAVRPSSCALHADDVETKKLDQLRHSLTGAAGVARQLGLSPAKAVRVLREVLDQAQP